MEIIKKYANRKLYHTNRKQYITLDGIARLIQDGAAVQVIDNESGDDITAAILAQVVLQARGRKSLIPTNLLTGLIQAGGDTLAGLRHSVETALRMQAAVDLEIGRRLQHLHDQQKISDVELVRLQELLIDQNAYHPYDDQAQASSASDIERLSAQVDALTAVVEQLLAERQQGPHKS